MKEMKSHREAKKPKMAKGGKCMAEGGVGKIRHEQATKQGAPLSKAEYKKKRI